VAGLTVYQGDIWMGPDALLDKTKAARFGLYITDAGYKWPGGTIPYEVDDAISGVVRAAIAKLAAATPLVLRPWQGERDYVSFQVGELNGSFVGCAGKRQVIGLARDAGVGVALHELCHAFGLWHEQSRPDRDQHVMIHEANIKAGCRPQFDIERSNAASFGPYDYASIMHYPADAFALPGTVTITTRDGNPIGQRNGLSQGDIASLRALYPGLNWP
jgi:astacin